MRKIKTILSLITVIFFSLILHGGQNSKVLRTDLMEPRTLDPTQCWDVVSAIYVHNIYDTLLSCDPQTLEIRSALAVSWEPREGHKSWVFDLRKGVSFHDGTELTADSVVFTFRRGQEKDFDHWYYDLPGYLGLIENLHTVRKINRYRVEFVFDAPYAPFLKALTSPVASIVSPEAVIQYREEFPRNPVGTGPYKLAEWESGKGLVLKMNDAYWGDRPCFHTIQNRFLVNIDQTIDFIREKKLDLTLRFSISKMESIQHLDWLKVQMEPQFSTTFLALNTGRGPLRDRNFRRALNYLWNKSYVKLVFQKYALPTDSILPRGMTGYNDRQIVRYPFSVAKAREMLEKAGVQTGTELTFLAFDPMSSLYMEMISFFSRSLEKAGIRLKIKKAGFEEYARCVAGGNYDLTLSGWSADYVHSHNFFSALFSKDIQERGFANLSMSGSGKIRELIDQAKREFDQKKQRSMYENLNRLVSQEALAIPLYQPLNIIILDKRIRGLESNGLGLVSFFRARVDED